MRFQLKKGHGNHRLRSPNGKMIIVKAEEVVDTTRETLGNAIDKFTQLDPDPKSKADVPRVGLIKAHRVGGGFDVLNETTMRPLNEKPLSEAEANSIIGKAAKDKAEVNG